MENKIGKIYNLKLTTFSPVHIGDSNDLEPTEYVICNDLLSEGEIICPECGYKNKPNAKYCQSCDEELHHGRKMSSKDDLFFLYTFTAKQLSEALSLADKNQLLEIARAGNFVPLQKFFKLNASKITQKASKHSVVCAAVAKQYFTKFGDNALPKEERNQFLIAKNVSNTLSGTAYIPGSSLKGAIRTALMSKRNETLHLDAEKYKKTTFKGDKYDASEAEKTLYNYTNQDEDPFKYLKLSDTVSDNSFLTEICVARNYKRKNAQPALYENIETIPPSMVFASQMSINTGVPQQSLNLRLPEDMASIRAACNKFYGNIMALEQSYITNQPHFYADLKQAAQKQNAFLLRLGKHCDAENVTIDDMRRIENKKSHEYMSHSTTYWLAENGREKLPFGWCVVEFEEVK